MTQRPTTTSITGSTTEFFVVRVHETDRGTLAVFAERDADGHKRSHRAKVAAFAAAGLLGGRAAGFRVLALSNDEHGNQCADYPRGDSGGDQ